MTEWDFGRCASLLQEVGDAAPKIVEVLERHNRADFPVRHVLQQVDGLFNALRKVKALLVRERKSRA